MAKQFRWFGLFSSQKRWPNRTAWMIGIVLVSLIALRIALPYLVKNYINKTLGEIPGYYGHVDDVDLHLWRGAYSVDNLTFVKRNGKKDEPLFAATTIDLAVDWGALLDRRIVSRIRMLRPELQFIKRTDETASQTSVDESWQKQVKKLIPLEINRLYLRDGLIRYKDETKSPKINVYVSRMMLAVTNLSNTKHETKRLPSKIDLDARLLKSGILKIDGRANILTEPIEADIATTIRSLDLVELNEFTKAYGNFDFEKGRFDLTSEIKATKSKYDGYVKTVARGVDVVDYSKERAEGKSVLHMIWEGMVGGLIEIFKNQRHDQFAAKIPIEGKRSDVEIGTWSAIGSLLRNAFLQALSLKFEDHDGKAEAPEAKK